MSPQDTITACDALHEHLRILYELAPEIVEAQSHDQQQQIKAGVPNYLRLLMQAAEQRSIDSSPLRWILKRWLALWRDHPSAVSAVARLREYLPEDQAVDCTERTTGRLLARCESELPKNPPPEELRRLAEKVKSIACMELGREDAGGLFGAYIAEAMHRGALPVEMSFDWDDPRRSHHVEAGEACLGWLVDQGYLKSQATGNRRTATSPDWYIVAEVFKRWAQEAEVETGGGEADAEEGLLREDVAILKAMACKPGMGWYQADIVSETEQLDPPYPLSRKTVGQRLNHLRSNGYVRRPQGRQRGDMLTDKGLKKAQQHRA